MPEPFSASHLTNERARWWQAPNPRPDFTVFDLIETSNVGPDLEGEGSRERVSTVLDQPSQRMSVILVTPGATPARSHPQDAGAHLALCAAAIFLRAVCRERPFHEWERLSTGLLLSAEFLPAGRSHMTLTWRSIYVTVSLHAAGRVGQTFGGRRERDGLRAPVTRW